MGSDLKGRTPGPQLTLEYQSCQCNCERMRKNGVSDESRTKPGHGEVNHEPNNSLIEEIAL